MKLSTIVVILLTVVKIYIAWHDYTINEKITVDCAVFLNTDNIRMTLVSRIDR